MTIRVLTASLVALGLIACAGPHSVAHGQAVLKTTGPAAARNAAMRTLLGQLDRTTRRCRRDDAALLRTYLLYTPGSSDPAGLAVPAHETQESCGLAAQKLNDAYNAVDTASTDQIQPALPVPLQRYLTVARLVQDYGTLADSGARAGTSAWYMATRDAGQSFASVDAGDIAFERTRGAAATTDIARITRHLERIWRY